jgi:hypothetical protein
MVTAYKRGAWGQAKIFLESVPLRVDMTAGGLTPNMASVSSISPVNQVHQSPDSQATQAKPPAKKPAPPPQDTVHLSHAAKAASSDADHDGDSK